MRKRQCYSPVGAKSNEVTLDAASASELCVERRLDGVDAPLTDLADLAVGQGLVRSLES